MKVTNYSLVNATTLKASLAKLAFSVVAFVMILFAALPGSSVIREPHTRVLVLGFTSPHMDEIAERVMREEMHRDLARRGIACVPVMETEAILRTYPNMQPGSVSEAEAKKILLRTTVTHIIEGTVVGSNAKKGDQIREGFLYRCRLKIYLGKKGKIKKLEINQKGEKDRYRFIRDFSRKVAAVLVEKGILRP